MITRTSDASMWNQAQPTGCPHQRYLAYHDRVNIGESGVWVARSTPPCKKRVCGQHGCHNFGKVFEEPDPGRRRFWIVSMPAVSEDDRHAG